MITRIVQTWCGLTHTLNKLQPLAALAARLYVAWVFFASGLTKLRDWDTTLALFTDEYHVPLLSPQLAAVMGTGGEIVLPIMLALGIGGRFAALGLSVINVVAVISLSEIAPAALNQHMLWGSLLAALALYGLGPLSLDRWLKPRLYDPLTKRPTC
jgi:putative oxidoreductase